MESGAKMIASSALLTTTSPNQKQIEEKLKEAGIRSNVKTIIGGAATSSEWAKEVGSDFYASTATEGVSIIKKYFEGLVDKEDYAQDEKKELLKYLYLLATNPEECR